MPAKSKWPWAGFLSSCCCCCCKVTSVVSDSVRPHRRQPTRLRCPWAYPGKNTGVGCHFLLLSLEQIWIILPPGEKEICLEVMAAIPKAKYWFKPNDIYFWTLTQISELVLLFSGLPQALMITGSDYSPPQPTSQSFLVNYFSPEITLQRKSYRLLASCQFPTSPA